LVDHKISLKVEMTEAAFDLIVDEPGTRLFQLCHVKDRTIRRLKKIILINQ
jgi:hypothetical protein